MHHQLLCISKSGEFIQPRHGDIFRNDYLKKSQGNWEFLYIRDINQASQIYLQIKN